MSEPTNETKLFHVLWNVARQELCTKAHKKDAKCIVLVTEPDFKQVAAALLQNDEFMELIKTLS